MEQSTPYEKKLLQWSVYFALFFAGLAIVWGVLGNSKVILFDGLYTLITMFLSAVSLWSASYMRKSDMERFPFGKEMLEPLVLVGKFLVISALCIYAIFSGLSALIAGGQEVNISAGLLYASIATFGSFGGYFFLQKRQIRLNSGLVQAEIQQWKMDSYLSLAVLVGFVIALALPYAGRESWTRFVDPVLVILASGFLLRIPLMQLREKSRELLDMTANEHYTGAVELVVEDIRARKGYLETFTRVAKSGPKLFVEIDFVVAPGHPGPSLQEQDDIRQEIMDAMDAFSIKKWLTVAFTADRKWAV